MQQNVKKIAILGLLEVANAIFLLFTKWVAYEYDGLFVDVERSFSLWEFADWWDEVAFLIYILLGLSIVLMLYTGYALYQNYKSGAKVHPGGFVCPGVLAVFIMIMVAADDHDLQLTAVPFLVLIIAIAASVINSKMPDTGPDNGETGPQRPAVFPTFTPRAPSRICPVCGAACADANATFCSSCGAKMDTKILCSCGAELKPNVRFCANCGAPVRVDPPKPDRKFDQKDN